MGTLILAVALAVNARAETPPISPGLDREVVTGIDRIYRMDFDGAEEAARRMTAAFPDHPYGYFGLAAVSWARYTYENEQTDQGQLGPFERRVEEAAAKASAWLKTHPGDPHALMALGAAYGIQGRLLAVRRDWIRAYLAARKANKHTRQAVAASPEFYDAQLGIGMYEYYTDAYPRLIRVLARIVLRGDRRRGIETLKLVAEKGRYARLAAKMVLVEIYTEDEFGDRDPAAAAAIMAEMRALYPDSPMLHSAELVSLYEGRRYEEVEKGALEFVARAEGGRYRRLDLAKGYVILGTTHWALGRREAAFEAFEKAAGVTLGGGLTRYAVWALIRAGQLEDAAGRRDAALANYRRALATPDHWGFHRLAKRFVSSPFRDGGHPGAIPPPY